MKNVQILRLPKKKEKIEKRNTENNRVDYYVNIDCIKIYYREIQRRYLVL